MNPVPASAGGDTGILPVPPPWIAGARGESLEDAAFLSGAALAHLQVVLTRADVPLPLLRARLALRAAEACMAHSGRSERAGDLRDALHLLRAGDRPGPAGEVYLAWRRGVERPISPRALQRALPGIDPATIAQWLDTGQGMPVARAAAALGTGLAAAPGREEAALILADSALAQALGWTHAVPLLGAGLTPRDLRKTGEALRLACHRAVVSSAVQAAGMAADLARRVTRLAEVAPKLRAGGAGEAVAMVLARDAVTPSELSHLMSGRAARRLCERLVRLGAVRELTGRDAFRIYGL